MDEHGHLYTSDGKRAPFNTIPDCVETVKLWMTLISLGFVFIYYLPLRLWFALNARDWYMELRI